MGLWRPRGEFQVGAIEVGQIGEVAVIQRAIEVEHLPLVESEFAREDLANRLRRVALDLESNGGGEAPFLDDLLDHLDQVFGDFLVASDLRVSRHPEEGGVDDFDVGKEQLEVRPDDVLEEDVPRVVAELNEPHLIARDLHAGEGHLLAGSFPRQDGQREALIRDERERVGRIERQRGQGRQDGTLEVLAQLLAFDGRKVVVVGDVNPRIGQRRADLLAITRRLPLEQRPSRLEGRRPLLVGRAPVRRLLGHAGRDLLFQPADALAEELVEVRGDDREELHALQQRVVPVERLVEDPSLEREFAEFAVQVVGRCREIDVRPRGVDLRGRGDREHVPVGPRRRDEIVGRVRPLEDHGFLVPIGVSRVRRLVDRSLVRSVGSGGRVRVAPVEEFPKRNCRVIARRPLGRPFVRQRVPIVALRRVPFVRPGIPPHLTRDRLRRSFRTTARRGRVRPR